MYEFAAKSFWAVAQPSNLIAILALSGLAIYVFHARYGKRFLITSAILMITFGMLPAGRLLLAPLENRFPSPQNRMPDHVDGIIVLGGAERPDLSMVRNQVVQTGSSERLAIGTMLARKYPDALVVYTGGVKTDTGMSEADVARKFHEGLGFSGARFIYEGNSVNTYENATRTFALLPPNPQQTWILVTSAYHMPRSVGTFRQVGWQVLPYPVDYQTGTTSLIPDKLDVAVRLREADLAIHEWIGLAAYRFLGKSNDLFPK